MAKVYLMKTSRRMRDRVEPQTLFKELVDLYGEYPEARDALINFKIS